MLTKLLTSSHRKVGRDSRSQAQSSSSQQQDLSFIESSSRRISSPVRLPASMRKRQKSTRASRSIVASESSTQRDLLQTGARMLEFVVLFKKPWNVSENYLEQIYRNAAIECNIENSEYEELTAYGRRYVRSLHIIAFGTSRV